MNEPIRGPIPREGFEKWLADGKAPLQVSIRDRCTTIIQLPKTDQIGYLFSETNYRSSSIHWNDRFSFCGLYLRNDESLHLLDDALCSIVDGLTPEECTGRDGLREKFSELVSRRIEAVIADDPQNLSVHELSSPRLIKKLDYHQKYGARNDAIQLLFSKGEPDLTFDCGYDLNSWTEDALLAYLQSPDQIIQSEAEQYIASHQEELLEGLLETDALRKAYTALMQDANDPVHRMKAITEAVDRCGAKTVNVTVQKQGRELTFRTTADVLKGCRDYYSIYHITAQDRKKFEELFGRHSEYRAEEVMKITYGRNTIYETQPSQSAVLAEDPGNVLASANSEEMNTRLQGHRPLVPEDLSVYELYYAEDGCLTFCLDVLEEEEIVFGRQLSSEEDESYFVAYVVYDEATGQVSDTLDIELRMLHDEQWFYCELSPEVQDALKQKLDTFCMERYHEHLPEPQSQTDISMEMGGL